MNITLRRVREDDCGDILTWANNPQTRRASFHGSRISLGVHNRWFKKYLNSPDRIIFIGVNSAGHKVGLVRFDKLNDCVVDIDVNVVPEMREEGYGLKLIKAACSTSYFKGRVFFIARIKKTNLISIKVFKRAGFFEICDYWDSRHGEVLVMGRMRSS